MLALTLALMLARGIPTLFLTPVYYHLTSLLV